MQTLFNIIMLEFVILNVCLMVLYGIYNCRHLRSKFRELAFCFFVIRQLFLNATIQKYQRSCVFKEFYDNLVGNVNTTPT